MDKKRTLLLVDDEPHILTSLKRLLRREGYRILTAADGEEGLTMMDVHETPVVISDQLMPGMTGVEMLSRIKASHPNTVRILLSGYADFQAVTAAINDGSVYKFLTKPWDDKNLRAHIREAFRYQEMHQRDRHYNWSVRNEN